MLPGRHDGQRGIRRTLDAIFDVDALGVHGYRNGGQACKLEGLAGDHEAGFFHPGLFAVQPQHPQCETQARDVARSDEDLIRQAVQVSGNGEIACNLPTQCELATGIGIYQ
ncbi:hypothetical protein D3C85_1419980 [compost metagenome]